MKNVCYYDFPIGTLAVACDGKGITDVSTGRIDGILKETPIICEAARQLGEYFEGKRKNFDVNLSINGTDFQKTVWKELMRIPYAKTRSYGEIAAAIGNPKAARAVGMANNKNKIMIIIPCHRVIGADGSLVGYAGGIEIKKKLLDLEKNAVK